MKITVTQRWTYRGLGERGPVHIDYAPGMHNVPRHIAAEAIEKGVAVEHKDKRQRATAQETQGASQERAGQDQADN